MRNINAHNDTVAVEVVGYLLEELRDSSNFVALKKDVASANIFVGSLIFVEELADKVLPPISVGLCFVPFFCYLCSMLPV